LKNKVNNCDFVDRVVCVEISDFERQLQLYVGVAKHMMHGPCVWIMSIALAWRMENAPNIIQCKLEIPPRWMVKSCFVSSLK